MLNTKCFGVAYFLKAMLWHFVLEPYQSLIIKEYYFKGYVWRVGVLMWSANCSLLHHIHMSMWMPFRICAVLGKKIRHHFSAYLTRLKLRFSIASRDVYSNPLTYFFYGLLERFCCKFPQMLIYACMFFVSFASTCFFRMISGT